MRRRHAFTLVELLVVMAIIAVLVSILMPALQKAREYAAAVVCMTNQRNLAYAWLSYQEDNNGYLCTGRTDGYFEHDWVRDDRANTVEEAKEGIARGVLYPYLHDTEVYHCPVDKRFHNRGRAWRSYAVPDSVSANFMPMGFWSGMPAYRYDQIKPPAQRYIFVEENLPSGTGGIWCMTWNSPCSGGFIDPMAVWHNYSSTLAFADGHAELQRWQDPYTIWLCEVGMLYAGGSHNPDLQYMLQGWNFWKWYKDM